MNAEKILKTALRVPASQKIIFNLRTKEIIEAEDYGTDSTGDDLIDRIDWRSLEARELLIGDEGDD
ncbi:MAG: hypothetical protein WCJ60_02215 [bacterium]